MQVILEPLRKKICFTFKAYLFCIYYLLLSFAIFLPLFRPGYILTLDMIWTANKNYLAEYFLCSSVGGQAPFLAILQFIEVFLPAWATQKMILFSVFLICGISAHISVPSESVYGKYFAGTLYAVNPFTYTRFLAGHLYLLLAYAFVPLAVMSFYDFLQDGVRWKRVLLWTTVVAIFNMHILFMVLLLQLCIFLFVIADAGERRADVIRHVLRLGLVFVAVNMFWILPVFSVVSGGSSALSHISTLDLSAFTGRGTISGNILISLAMMYGFWREGYVYPFHLAPKWVFVVLFAMILYFVVQGFSFGGKKHLHRGLALSALISLVLASGVTYPFFAPVFTFLFEHFFIFRGMRDSQKFVGVLVLVYSFLGGMGVDELFTDFRNNKRIKKLSKSKNKICSAAIIAIILAVPLLYSFTTFNGFHGQIKPKDYPSEWYEVNEFLKNDTRDFDLLFFPWHLYMTFRWSDRRIANPAPIFFEKPVIYGQNVEVGSIQIQSSNPTQHYIEYLLEHRGNIRNFGELIAPLNVGYVILAKDLDYHLYDFLYEQSDLTVVMENEELAVFGNLHDISRIRRVASLTTVADWGELVEQSKTIDINNCGYVLSSADAECAWLKPADTPREELNYTRVSLFGYRLHEGAEYILFTPPDHDPGDWVLDSSSGLDSPGLTSVFVASGQNVNGGEIYFKPITAHLIGAVVSVVAVVLVLLSPRVWQRWRVSS